MLGSAHLGDLLDGFAGSYIMTIAAYNAGAHRVSQWVETYGDPRDPTVDPIDWMENIPFTETRNYVQRVMENIQVYRARLGNQSADLRIEQDIARYDGTEPIIQTTPRPQMALTPVAPRAPRPQLAVPAPVVAAIPPAAASTPVATVAPNADLPLPNPNRIVVPTSTQTPILESIAPVENNLETATPALNVPADETTQNTNAISAMPEKIDGAMQPVMDGDDIASRAARGLASPIVSPALVTPPVETPTTPQLAPLVAQPSLVPAAPLAIQRNEAPVRLIPPSALDRPRAPSTMFETDTSIPNVTSEPGTMSPIADERSGR